MILNLENLDLVKINDKCYKLFKICDSKRENIIIDINNIFCPFGIEKFFGVSSINFEVSEELSELFLTIEKDVYALIKNDNKYKDYKFISSIKKRNNYPSLIKTRIKETKNKYIIESNSNIYSLKFKDNYNISICLDSIWFNKSSCGILFILKQINEII
jgi:hypothetical protein